jgi:hypothetical protein
MQKKSGKFAATPEEKYAGELGVFLKGRLNLWTK